MSRAPGVQVKEEDVLEFLAAHPQKKSESIHIMNPRNTSEKLLLAARVTVSLKTRLTSVNPSQGTGLQWAVAGHLPPEPSRQPSRSPDSGGS